MNLIIEAISVVGRAVGPFKGARSILLTVLKDAFKSGLVRPRLFTDAMLLVELPISIVASPV